MAQVHFRLKDENRNVTAIMLDCRYGTTGKKHRLRMSTQRSIEPKNWNKNKQRPKHQLTEKIYIEIKNHLDKTATIIEEFLAENLRANIVPSSQETKAHYLSLVNPIAEEVTEEDNTDAVHHFQNFIRENSSLKKHRTVQKYEGLLRNLIKFSLSQSQPSNELGERPKLEKLLDAYHLLPPENKIHLQSFDKRFENRYRTFLVNQNFTNDTIGKNFSTLKTILNWLNDMGVETPKVYLKYKASQSTKVENLVLTEEELNKFNHYQLNSNLLTRAKDLFCFMAYTGQRWEDYESFKKSDVKQDTWTFYISKTKDNTQTRIPFTGYLSPAKLILEKYNGNLPCEDNGSFFTLNRFNDLIKEAAKQTGQFDSIFHKVRYSGSKKVSTKKPKYDLISQYTARRTFCTILASKIPITQLMMLTGHSKITTLNKYINHDFKSLIKNLNNTNHITN